MSPQQQNEVFDYDSLSRRCLGNINIIARVLDIFSNDFDEALHDLDTLISDSDFESVRNLAHRLKGASGNAAANQLHELSAKLEELARQGETQASQATLRQLQAAWGDFQSAVAAFPHGESP